MRKLRLAVTLPIAICGVDLLLLFWGTVSKVTVLTSQGLPVKPSAIISTGLDAPSVLLSGFVYASLQTLADLVPGHHNAVLPGDGALAFVCVLGCWFLIGKWLDERQSANAHVPPGRPSARSLMTGLLLLGAGLLLADGSLHVQPYSVAEATEKALWETWAVFVFGLAVVSLGGYAYRVQRRDSNYAGITSRLQRVSNIQLLLIILSLFLAFCGKDLLQFRWQTSRLATNRRLSQTVATFQGLSRARWWEGPPEEREA